MKKKVLLLITGIAFFGLMALNVQNSIGDDNLMGLNISVLSQNAIAACEGVAGGGLVCCTEYPGDCLWGTSGGEFYYDDATWYF